MSYVMLGAAEDVGPPAPEGSIVTPEGQTIVPGDSTGAPAGAQIDPALVKQFGPIAATLGMSLAQFLSSIGVAIRYVAVSEEEKRRAAAKAAAEAASKTNLTRYAGPALLLGLGGFVAFQIAKKRRRGAASAA